MATTLLLDRAGWDLALNASGDIALASEPYAQEQDVASMCRVFAGECYYDIARGVPYFEQILGQYQPIQVMKAQYEAAALLVPGVTAATVFLTDVIDRAIGGQIQIETTTGTGIVAL
jgi:hypothetical protein